MADKKISELTAGSTPLAGTELIELIQGGDNVQVAAQAIADLAGGGLPSQAGQAGKVLGTDGTVASWVAALAGLKVGLASIRGNTGEILWSLGFDGMTYNATGEYEFDITSLGLASSQYIVMAMSDELFVLGAIFHLQIVDAATFQIRAFQVDPGDPSGYSATDPFFKLLVVGT